ncbi:unnamed protein product [Sphagnum tenellum]
MYGLMDAEPFEKSFAAVGRGRKQCHSDKQLQLRQYCCNEKLQEFHAAGSFNIYGWQATEQDLKGHLGLLTQHLCKFSDLKTVADVMEDKDRINDQLVQNLMADVGRRNNCLEACHEQFIVLQYLVAEVDNLCLKAEEEKRKVEEKHKQGHDALIMALLVFTSYGIGKSKDVLLQMLKARMAQQQKTKLVLNQKQELEFQHVSEVLEMECGKIHLRGSCQDETNNIESDKKKITALESKLADLQSTYEFSDSLVSDLTKKERATNDEMKRHAKWQSWYSASSLAGGSLKLVLKDYGAKDKLEIKLMGEIEKEPWEAACRLKYRFHDDGWDIQMATQISKGEALLMDHCFCPLKMVQVSPNQFKDELGEKVCNTVIDALFELEEYNSGGRYPVEVLWDSQKKKMVVSDLIFISKDLLDAGKRKAPKRHRGRY